MKYNNWMDTIQVAVANLVYKITKKKKHHWQILSLFIE